MRTAELRRATMKAAQEEANLIPAMINLFIAMNLIRTLVFNPIQTNTYVLQNAETAAQSQTQAEAGTTAAQAHSEIKGVIIDPACATTEEFEQLRAYIAEKNITIEKVLLTHPHFDHFMGAAAVCKHYGLPLYVHEKALSMLTSRAQSATVFGMPNPELPEKMLPVKDGDTLTFGDAVLEVRYAPGHSEGSVVYVWHEQRTVFTGDVLFRESIGRTDLPTGDFDILRKSILEKVFTLDDEYTVRPGHGGRTSVGYERANNPFL